MSDNRYFYRDLPVLRSFSEAMQTEVYVALPEDWLIVVADVIGSTRAIEAGNYKKVNTIGVACIASMVNVDRDIDIPFVFGGDGATFAIPGHLFHRAIIALRGSQKLSRESFDLGLRIGVMKVGDLAEQGFRVNVAKVRLSPDVTQATFSGRGWREAERRVKSSAAAGVIMVREEDGPAEANFEGFECRWREVPSFNGHKLSLLVAAMSNDPAVNLETYQEVVEKIKAIYGDVADYHPLRPNRMRLTLNPKLLSHEWLVRSGKTDFFARLAYFIRMLAMNLAGIYLFSRNQDTRTTPWSHYRAALVENTDFRKFDGMLRMVIDGSDAQASQLEAYLDSRYREGRLVYGLYKSPEALVTCLVQSYTGSHMHFVDGSDGGYAMAAIGLKRQLLQSEAARKANPSGDASRAGT